MNLEEFQKVKTIFEKALELEVDKRNDFINSECKNNEELKREVLSLLNVYDETSEFLEVSPNIMDPLEDISSFKDSFIGKRISNYVIEDVAGVGGMGIVYKGRRDDKEFEQLVAIKILKHHLNSEYALKRFKIERQTLAKLQHPNIARLLDGGTTDEGLPYLVMEYIDGVSLIDYCDSKNLNIKQRLELFKLVCGAIQYAHQNLIVHRDIKPGNVLVDKEGRPKLLDFGIAKLIDEDISEDRTQLTKPGMWHLTPEYSSPEQIKGETVTTKSDIYSLGILLYQLLTGHQPYKITSASPIALSKLITEGSVLKPSDKFQTTEEITLFDGSIKQITPKSVSLARNEKPEKIYHHLKGDIDNIILKAIHKDPARRYESVEQFSEDIRRHLIGLPVIARSDTVGYRLTKFIQRHKVGFASSIIFILFLIGSAIMIAWQANIAADERDKAQIEAQKSEEVNSFLQRMLSSVDPSELGRDVKVYDILDKASKDIETSFKDQPEVEASIRSTIGNTYVNLGEYDKAKPFLDKALEINQKVYGPESEQVAFNIHDFALYYDWVGEYKIADSLYNKSIKILRKVLKQPTKRFADALNNYGIIKMYFEKYDEAEKLFTEAIDIALSAYGEKNTTTATFMNNLALNYTDAGNLDEAEKYYKKSMKILIELLGENRPEIGTIYNNLAYLSVLKKNYKMAEDYLIKSYNLKRTLKGEDHSDVGLALNNLGVINFRMGNYNKAEQYLIDAITQYRKSFDDNHPRVALSQYWLGKVYLETGRLKKSEEYLKSSLTTRIKKLPEENKDIWRSKTELGICLLKQKKYKEAEKLLLPALKYYKANFFSDTEQLTRLYENIIKLYQSTGDLEKSGEYTDQMNSFLQQDNTEK